MRTQVPRLEWAMLPVFVLALMVEAAGAEGESARAIPGARTSASNRAAPSVQGIALFSDTGEPIGTYYPMTPDVRRLGGIAGANDPDAACRADPGAVYCNTLSPGWWQPPGDNPNIVIGDDASLAAVAGCELDRYVLKVTGNADGLGSGPYAVDVALYTMCPGVGGASVISGTECQVTLPDEGPALVVCDADPGTTLPTNNLWVGLQFSRLHCGLAAGAPATKGFSGDMLHFPGFSCIANLGGFAQETRYDDFGKHASFYLEIYTRGACADPESDPPTEAFPNYKGSNHAGLSYTPGGGIRFADDISLFVPECYLSRIEVAVKGTGVTNIDLRTNLVDADPVNGGVIPGTQFFVVGGVGIVIASRNFEPPILLPQPDLWVGYVTTSAITGPIITGTWGGPSLGQNEDAIWIHDGTRWNSGPLTGRPYAATNVTIHCAGSPPTGSCCDMAVTENRVCVAGDNHGASCISRTDCPGGTCVGDAVCRDDLSQMNCATGTLSELWVPGGVCEGVCVGGDNDGAPCTRQIDCPGRECVGGPNVGSPCQTDFDCQDGGECKRAACDGPFNRSCGLAACCTAFDECLDLTRKECFEQPPIEEPRSRVFQYGTFCGGDTHCPFGACLRQRGDCSFARDEPGCDDPFCCGNVCEIDEFCCYVVWDAQCVSYAIDECGNPPSNDECFGRGYQGAHPVPVPGNILVDLLNATRNQSEPGFCCHEDDPGAQGRASVWFKFVGPEPANAQDEFSSVRIETCQSNSLNGRESLLQVFELADSDRGMCSDGSLCSISAQDCTDASNCALDEEFACQNLIAMACSDDTPIGCGSRPGNSRVCVPNVVPGRTYYIMVGIKDEDFRDVYRLDIIQGCRADLPIPNDRCVDAHQLRGATSAIPFDLSGGAEFANATFDCQNPPGVLPNMENDIWYDWIAPVDGTATIETCDGLLSPADQPNTTMIIYEGCDCPTPDGQGIAWSDFCGFGCGLSSCVEIDIAEGQCYKIRLGGHRGGTPSGTLFIQAESRADCNENGRFDYRDIADGTSQDCNNNGTPDECDIAEGTSPDSNGNDVPDECDECLADVECDDDNPCTLELCEAGICTFPPVPEGTPCPDGVFCNGAETCQGGQCIDGPAPCPGRCSEQSHKCLLRMRDVTTIMPRRKP